MRTAIAGLLGAAMVLSAPLASASTGGWGDWDNPAIPHYEPVPPGPTLSGWGIPTKPPYDFSDKIGGRIG